MFSQIVLLSCERSYRLHLDSVFAWSTRRVPQHHAVLRRTRAPCVIDYANALWIPAACEGSCSNRVAASVARKCTSGTIVRAAVDEGERGHTRGSHGRACFGLSTERSLAGETNLSWREQRRGDGGGTVFALCPLAKGLRRWSGVDPVSEQRTRRPAESMYTPCTAPSHRRMLHACAPALAGSSRQKRSMRRSIPPI